MSSRKDRRYLRIVRNTVGQTPWDGNTSVTIDIVFAEVFNRKPRFPLEKSLATDSWA